MNRVILLRYMGCHLNYFTSACSIPTFVRDVYVNSLIKTKYSFTEFETLVQRFSYDDDKNYFIFLPKKKVCVQCQRLIDVPRPR